MRPGLSEGEAVDDLVARALTTARLERGWAPQAVADALATQFYPRVLDTATRGGISIDGPGTGLTLWIAGAPDGRGDLLRLRMHRDIEIKRFGRDEPVGVSMPDEVQPGFFERQPMMELRARLEAGSFNPRLAARQVSDVIRETIAFEASLHDGQNVAIGGRPDVAIVDGDGTRWWLDSEAKRRLRKKSKKG